MHELSVVEETVARLTSVLTARGISQATAVRFQRGSTFSEETLRQAFEMASTGTPLEGAELIVEVKEVVAACRCGRSQTVTERDLLGHIFVCPACGAMQEVAEADSLRVLDVTVV